MKGTAKQGNKVLIKPLITEKATHLAVINKYVFAINPKMNKVEVKKAIRAVYKVDPIKINISNFSGKAVRYGKTSGKTKSWKKAIVTLKAGDKIEVYEGV
ncbi:MAG: 50S ribosomal protein L23 [Patescibacteria group bacterium]|nr:50S ribosomal protein L23 [Patescibacteria group bacterium]